MEEDLLAEQDSYNWKEDDHRSQARGHEGSGFSIRYRKRR